MIIYYSLWLLSIMLTYLLALSTLNMFMFLVTVFCFIISLNISLVTSLLLSITDKYKDVCPRSGRPRSSPSLDSCRILWLDPWLTACCSCDSWSRRRSSVVPDTAVSSCLQLNLGDTASWDMEDGWWYDGDSGDTLLSPGNILRESSL